MSISRTTLYGDGNFLWTALAHRAAHALCKPVELLDPQCKRSFAIITTRKA